MSIMKKTVFFLIGITLIFFNTHLAYSINPSNAERFIIQINGKIITKHSADTNALIQKGLYEQNKSIIRNHEYPSINIPVLMYHNIDSVSKSQYWVSLKNFKAQMKYLKSYGFNTINLIDIINYIKTGKLLPKNPIVLTFDDGYENFYTMAYPVLKNLAFKATEFLITDYIGNSEDDRKLNTWDMNPNERSFLHKHLIWPEILKMAKNNISFEAHSKTHPRLTTLSLTELDKQISGSKNIIIAKLGKCDFFNYPYGNLNTTVVDKVKEKGFLGAVDVNHGGIFNTSKSDVYKIERQFIHSKMKIDTFAKTINPSIKFPDLDVLSVIFYDANGKVQDEFKKGKSLIIKVTIKNNGAATTAIATLKLIANDSNILANYDTQLNDQPEDKLLIIEKGEEKTIQFTWRVPKNTTMKQWYYNIAFHGKYYCLWYGETGWVKGFTIIK